MPFSKEQRQENKFLLFHHTLNAGAASPNALPFRVPVACTLISTDITVTASDATDKVSASLRSGTTAIMLTVSTGTAKQAQATAAEASQTLDRNRNEIMNLLLVYAGTAANVTGICVQVWAVRRG